MRNHGFTLIELMIVVAIIGILAGIGIQTYQGTTAKARDKTAMSDVKNFMTLISAAATE